MKVGIDLSFIDGWHEGEGIGYYIFYLLKAFQVNGMLENCCLFVNQIFFGEARERYPEADTVLIKQRKKGRIIQGIIKRVPKLRELNSYYPYWVLYQRLAVKHGCDRYFYPYAVLPLRIFPRMPTIITVHDLFYINIPDYYPVSKQNIFASRHAYFIHKADLIIAISEHVKNDLIKHFPRVDRSKIEVIHNPVTVGGLPFEEPKIKGKYILSVNNLRKHKNMMTLVRAFHQIANKIEHSLVLVGKNISEDDLITDYIKAYNLESRVIRTGLVDDLTRNQLYHNADLFISPSLHEGFGMSPVEAMMMEVPVITSRETSLPEATCGMANYYELAEDHDALARKITAVLDRPLDRDKLRKIKEHLSARYNPERIALKYWAAFEKALQVGKR